MSADSLGHARWLISHFTRDEEKRLVIAASSRALVERRVDFALSDDAQRDEFLDQILRLAHGAFTEGGEVELARSLVGLVLRHPAGQQRLEKTAAGKAWAVFAAESAPRHLPIPDRAPPAGSIGLRQLVTKFRP